MTTRWRPTGEQIALLKAIFSEELHRPNRHEIEQITSRLRMYGNIESKNVYYWFHNNTHRKRRREKLERAASIVQSDRPPSLAAASLTNEICEVQWQSAVVIRERQVVVNDNEPLTLELFPLHPTGIAEQKYEALNTLGLQRSVCNPNEQNDATSGRAHVHKFFHFISQHPGK